MGKKYLKRVTESKLAPLLKNVRDKESLEASGVVAREKDILVVMDCMKGIGRLAGQNKKHPLGKGKIVGPQRTAQGFEDYADISIRGKQRPRPSSILPWTR